MEEKRGLTHWAIYTDGESIFAWDIILNTAVERIMTDLNEVTALAVDSSRGFIFILET